MGLDPGSYHPHRLHEGLHAGHCSYSVSAAPALAVPALAQGDSWLVAWTVLQGQPSETGHALPRSSWAVSASPQWLFGCLYPGPPVPSSITPPRVFPAPLLSSPGLPWGLSVSLSRVSFGMFPGLALLCFPAWTVLWGAAYEDPWTVRLLRATLPPGPGCPCPNVTLSQGT